MPPKRSESVAGTEPLSEQTFKDFAKKIKTLIAQSEQSINSRLKRVEEKFTGIINEMREEISDMHKEVDDIKTDIDDVKSQADEVEKSINFHAAKVEDMEKDQNDKRLKLEQDLTEKIEELDRKLLQLEKQDRKYNLIFYGIAEERQEKLYEKMLDFFIEYLEIAPDRARQIHFSNGHRLPVDSKFVGPKPIIMRFSSYDDRELVLSHAFKLANKGKSIQSDLPVVMKKERQRLARIAYTIRNEEKLKTRIRDRGLCMVLEVKKVSDTKWTERKA